MSLKFRIFTLNCWGIAFVSKDRRSRIKAIAEYLARSNYDVVCLQEVWSDQDFFAVKDVVADVLPYSHYFYSGVIGSGLCLFSKHLIEETFFHQWPLNGYIHKVYHGDWFGGKGVGMCTLSVNKYKINVYTAHLHAEYDRNRDEYEAHRILQAYDTAQFILLTSKNADLVVLAGDLNTLPGDLAYRVIKSVPGLVDAFEFSDVPKSEVATCDSLRNSYTSQELVKQKLSGLRIDYIMYHPGSKLEVELKSYKLPLPARVPSCSFSYSDHEAIEATLEISTNAAKNIKNDADLKTVLHDCIFSLEQALDNLANNRMFYTLIYIFLLAMVTLSFGFDAPAGFSVLYNFLRVIFAIVAVFYFLMANIWNKIEKHAILAGKTSMELKKRSEL